MRACGGVGWGEGGATKDHDTDDFCGNATLAVLVLL